MKDIKFQIQESHQTPTRINIQKFIPRDISYTAKFKSKEQKLEHSQIKMTRYIKHWKKSADFSLETMETRRR